MCKINLKRKNKTPTTLEAVLRDVNGCTTARVGGSSSSAAQKITVLLGDNKVCLIPDLDPQQLCDLGNIT